MPRIPGAFASVLAIVFLLIPPSSMDRVSMDDGAAVVAAAGSFIASLGEEASKKAVFPFDVAERRSWDFIPRVRPGLPLKEMDDAQRRCVHDLLRTVLSSRGYLKATSIMALEKVLRAIEQKKGQSGAGRDHELYYVAIYGKPAAAGAWGFRVEGHHLSLNFSFVGGQLASSTPYFHGTAPATVLDGPDAGLKILGEEERLAFEILATLDKAQRAVAVIDATAPPEIVNGPAKLVLSDPPRGILVAKLPQRGRKLLDLLIAEFVDNLSPDLAEKARLRLGQGDAADLHFAWAGADRPGIGHYWRIQGRNFLIELDNTQNGANHVHTVWRDLTNDFGAETLRQHLEHDHRGK